MPHSNFARVEFLINNQLLCRDIYVPGNLENNFIHWVGLEAAEPGQPGYLSIEDAADLEDLLVLGWQVFFYAEKYDGSVERYALMPDEARRIFNKLVNNHQCGY